VTIHKVTCMALGLGMLAPCVPAQDQCTAANAGTVIQGGQMATDGCSVPLAALTYARSILSGLDPEAAAASLAGAASPDNPAGGKNTWFSNRSGGPCDIHDYCYAECWATTGRSYSQHKQDCDSGLAGRLLAVCQWAADRGEDSAAVIRACRFFAQAYADAFSTTPIDLITDAKYSGGQTSACLVCPGPPPSDCPNCWKWNSTALAYVWNCPGTRLAFC
jgi:hypothetical protein